MKSYYLLAFIFFIPIISFAQKGKESIQYLKEFKIINGIPYSVVEARDKEYFTDGNQHAVFVKTEKRKFSIRIFDINTMKEVARKDY